MGQKTFSTVYETLTRMNVDADVRLTVSLPSLVGKTVGRFLILRELGRGGMGLVYEGEDPDLQRQVAIKVLSGRTALQPGGVERFVIEARLTSQLDHPHIVPVHEMGVTEEGQLFFVMKRVTGQSLAALINALAQGEVVWSEHRRLVAFQQLCQAVAFAHSREVIHRDIKPSNVMVGQYGEVLLMDWGIARIMGTPTPIDRSSGTPGYMAPEVIRGALGDARADIFALGALVYELLLLQPAFPGASQKARLARSATLPPRRTLSEPLWEIVRHAVAPDPADRFQSAEAFSGAIEAYLDGSRRRAEAMEMVARAREKAEQIKALQERYIANRETVHHLIHAIKPYEPIAAKLPLWSLKEEQESFERQLAREEIALLEAARGALARSPDLIDAQHLLADWFYRKHRLAEENLDLPAMARAEEELRLNDTDGRYAHYLSGEGRWTLLTEPAGAAVQLYRVRERQRRYIEEPFGAPLTTPIRDAPLGMGAWMAVVTAPGRATTRVSLRLARNEHWHNIPPGDTTPAPLRLPRAGALQPGDIFIPGGWARIGSQHPMSNSAFPPQDIWIDDFVIRQHMTTNQEYLLFLNTLVASGREDEALQWAPRSRSGSADSRSSAGSLIYGRDADGRFCLVPDPDGDLWDPEWPVIMINWRCSRAYAAFIAEKTGKPWRLPTELECEKASRGADGREAPYGPFVEPSWSLVASSFAGRRLPRTVSEDAPDRSPYGVDGLSGNARTWCLDVYEATPKVHHRRALVVDPGETLPEDATLNVRGGGFSLNDRTGYSASRSNNLPGFRSHYLGIRLARSLNDDDV